MQVLDNETRSMTPFINADIRQQQDPDSDRLLMQILDKKKTETISPFVNAYFRQQKNPDNDPIC